LKKKVNHWKLHNVKIIAFWPTLETKNSFVACFYTRRAKNVIVIVFGSDGKIMKYAVTYRNI